MLACRAACYQILYGASRRRMQQPWPRWYNQAHDKDGLPNADPDHTGEHHPLAAPLVRADLARSVRWVQKSAGTRRDYTGGQRRVILQDPTDEEIRDLLERSGTVAIVGLSEKPYRTSQTIARSLQGFGFKIFPVNPNLDGPVLGEEPYGSVAEIEEPVDIVNVFRRSEKAPPVARDAVAAGAKVLWMQSGVVNEEAASHAREHGLTVVMDRCIMVEYASLVGR
jgi:uncharacterized protein